MAQNVKSVNGLAIASVKSFDGLAIASVKSIIGVDNTSAGGSVTFNSVTGTADLGGTTLTFAHDVGSGSNRALFVGVGWMFGPSSITSVTFNGVAMTQVWTVASTSITNKSVGFILVNPDSGSHDVVVTFPSAVSDIKAAAALSFTGVHQTTPTGTPQTANAETGTNPSVTVGSVGSVDIVVDMLAAYGSTAIAADANQTSRYESENLFSNQQYFGASTQPGADGGVMSWTATASSYYAYGAVAIKPA